MFEYGSEWIRTDFHLHTIKDKEFKFEEAHDRFVGEYVKKLADEDIGIAVITNHNKFDLGEYKVLRRKAKREDILILPGIELSIKEGKHGIHCLIVFNPDEWLVNGETHIEDFLTAAFLGIDNRENENTTCNFDMPKLLDELDKLSKDYFIVFAHVDQDSGLFNECDGGLIKSLSKKHNFGNRVLGLQKARNRDNLENFRQWTGYELACVEGSDPKSISDIGKGKHKTYLKVGDLSFQVVKFALQDYHDRVSSTKPKIAHGYVKSVSYLGGKLDGITIPFSSSLNTIIGIRGSGKSAILETLRYAFNLPAVIDSQYKDDLVKHILGSGGEVTVNVVDSHGDEYKIKRLVGEKPYLLDKNNEVINLPLDTVINNPLYFGQKDLSFTNKGYEFELLEKLVGNKLDEHQQSLNEINKTIEEDIRAYLGFENISKQIEILEGKNNALNINIDKFKENGVDKKLEKQASYKADLREINNLIETIEGLLNKVKTVYDEFEKKEFRISQYESRYNEDLMIDVQKTHTEIFSEFSKVKHSIVTIDKGLARLNEYKDTLDGRIQSLTNEFAGIMREIGDETTDPEKYLEYIEEHAENVKKIEELREKNSSKGNLETKIKTSFKKRNDRLGEIFQEYDSESDKINHSQTELQIDIHFKGDKESFVESMQENFKGTGISRTKYERLSEEFSDYSGIYEDYLFNDGSTIQDFLTINEYAKISEMLSKNYAELIYIPTPNLVEIYYHDKLLEKHSVGQRASAIILLILSQKENDLIIIDQPEDDLDNQVIYREVISTLKERKSDIQFIFATHNANIPVLGDAERIISTEYGSGKINIELGNIDYPDTHRKIVDIMEGGAEAFKRREMIYSNWSKSRT
ncbi:MAG TPA: hypothetical protein PKI14_11475 [Fervidobacterium sp.]|nr:hypothetical protein [Bacteroidales bacterium]HQE49346.1 hypothetical protein [Fervidobacterium sp.]HUM43555.1 hypothetical protein [Fervidobacterium sp.]